MNVKKLNSILLAGILCLFPLGIQASTTYATSEDGTKNYTSIDDAWDAAQNGTKIIMQEDWNLSSRLVLDSNKTATIEMNGHKISRNLTSAKTNGEVIKLCSNSTLTLSGQNAPKTRFDFKGYFYGASTDAQTISGGLITGGYSTNGGGGIHMKSGSTLKLDSISVSGNKSNRSLGTDGHGGAIYMDGSGDQLIMNNAEITFNAAQRNGGGVYVNNKDSSIEMNNNSQIIDNSAGANLDNLGYGVANGGGIAIDAENVTVTLNSGSSISDNYCHAYGGGIYSNAKNTKVYLNASSIDTNSSDDNGGGIYFKYSNFEVGSTNKDGQIFNNKSQLSHDGGGIYADRCIFSSNQGKIDGITFTSNSADRGGGMSIQQENVTISNCTFKNNSANTGAAIDIENDDIILENLTVQENTTTSEKSGAVEIVCYNDITLNGILNITNNINSITNTDADLHVDTFNSVYSYIISTPNASSKIGLFIDFARTLAKNQTSDATNIYYVNNPNDYTIRYDESSKQIVSEVKTNTSEENQDKTKTYTVTMNMVNEAGTWQNTQKMTVDENTLFELQAPAVEDKEFVEFKDLPESLTVENDLVKADSISEDIEITLVYSDEESESLETGSIFGNSNTIIAAMIVVAVVILGTFIFMKKKKSS